MVFHHQDFHHTKYHYDHFLDLVADLTRACLLVLVFVSLLVQCHGDRWLVTVTNCWMEIHTVNRKK